MATVMRMNMAPARAVLFDTEAPADAAELHLLVLWALERLDQGVLLLSPQGGVRFANRCARDLMAGCGLLDVSSGQLQATLASDAVPLRDALRAASERGHVRMLRLGAEAQAQYLTLAGIGPAGHAGPVVALLGRHRLCNALALQWFAQCHELTAAESNVLCLLCEGLEPREVAQRAGVALSTVRTQIGSIRIKTGHESIRCLLTALGRLPPISATLLARCAAGT